MKRGILAVTLLLAIGATSCDDATPVPEELANNHTELSQAGNGKPASGSGEPAEQPPTQSAQQPAAPANPPPSVPNPPVQEKPFVQRTEGQTAHDLEKPTATVRQYLAYVPKGYNADSKRKWPVILFLHGMGEQGTNVNNIFWTYFAWKTMDKSYPYILITPQLLTGNDSWSASDLDKMLDEILPNYNVDYARIVLTGYSMGARGVFDLAEYDPGRFAAAVPVAGWGNTNMAHHLKDMAMWAFHGDSDPVVNVSGSMNMIKAIKDAGGVKASLTIYAGRGHDVHATTYDNPAVIDWMLAQRK